MHINCLEERKMQREKEEEREGGQIDTFHILLGFRRRIQGPAGFSHLPDSALEVRSRS